MTQNKLHCSFCGKSETEVAKLCTSPGGVYICDACVEAARVVMAGPETPGLNRAFDPTTWPTERLTALLKPIDGTIQGYREHLQSIVDTLRVRKTSWAVIGEALGVTRQAAWERFS
jgi:hypothetical protein